eukprot:Polyplicarium_translucidae@DN5589_c0_g1_i1.p3
MRNINKTTIRGDTLLQFVAGFRETAGENEKKFPPDVRVDGHDEMVSATAFSCVLSKLLPGRLTAVVDGNVMNHHHELVLDVAKKLRLLLPAAITYQKPLRISWSVRWCSR